MLPPKPWGPATPEDYLRLPLKAHAMLADMPLHDVWRVRLDGADGERSMLEIRAIALGLVDSANLGIGVRTLFGLRRWLGARMGWDRDGSGATSASLRAKLEPSDREASLIVLLGGFYEANLGSATGVVREVPVPWVLVISQLGFASVLTYVLVNADVRSASRGLTVGAAFGLLYGIAISFDLFAVTNWSNVNVALVEPLVTAARMAAVGSMVGWVLGRGPHLETAS